VLGNQGAHRVTLGCGRPVSFRVEPARVAAPSHACHNKRMEQKHPHAEAIYRVISLADKTFGVEVAIPDSEPATVTSFATAADAEAWIAAHKERVARSPSLTARSFRGGKRR
jgi:hypothetical protein